MLKIFLSSVMVFFGSTVTLFSQSSGVNEVEVDTIPLDPHVTYGRLKNGLTYYLDDRTTYGNQVEIRLVVKAGNLHNDSDQTDYAHLLEHMGYKGTANFPDAPLYFEKKGGHIYANTADDFTRYTLTVPAGDKSLLLEGLQWLSEITTAISLGQSSIDVERGAVLGENRTTDPHAKWIQQLLKSIALASTNYRDRYTDILHTAKNVHDIKHFNRDAFLRFYRDWYRTDNEALTVVGNFNPDSLEVYIKDVFSDLAPHPGAPDRVNAILPGIEVNGRNQYEMVADSIDRNTRLVFASKSVDYGNHSIVGPSDYQNYLIQELYKTLLAKRSKGITQTYNPILKDVRFLERHRLLELVSFTMMFDQMDKREAEQHLASGLLLWKELHAGITDKELQEAKEEVKKAYRHSSQNNIALSVRYQNHFVRNVAVPGSQRELELVAGLLANIQLTDLQGYADRMSNLESNKDFVFFNPNAAKVPELSEVKRLVAEINRAPVSIIETRKESIHSLVSTDERPSMDLKEIDVVTNGIGVISVQLPHNIRVFLKPTEASSDFFSESVRIYGYRTPGVPFKDNKAYTLATMAPEIVQFSGAGGYDSFQLSDFMTKKGITFHMSADAFAHTLQASVKRNQLDELFALIQLFAEQPRKDQEALVAWKRKKIAMVNGTKGRVSSNFYMDHVKTGQYPALSSIGIDDIKGLEMDKVYHAYERMYAGFDGFTFIVTGDFDPIRDTERIISNLAALPKGMDKIDQAPTLPTFEFRGMTSKIELDNFNQNSVFLEIPIAIKNDMKTEIIMDVLASALHELVFDTLREGSYSPGASGSWIDKEEGIYAFQISFDTELGEEDKMLELAKKVYNELRENGVDGALFQAVLNTCKNRFNQRVGNFGFYNFWEDYIRKKLRNNENMSEEVLQYMTWLEHFISVEDVNLVAKKYLTDENLQQFLIVPKDYSNGQ